MDGDGGPADERQWVGQGRGDGVFSDGQVDAIAGGEFVWVEGLSGGDGVPAWGEAGGGECCSGDVVDVDEVPGLSTGVGQVGSTL